MVWKWRIGLVLTLIAVLALGSFGTLAEANTPEKQVSVTIPNLPVTVDGQAFDSRDLKYPLLVRASRISQ